jgi:tRNA (cytidine/uridine-2'-O-)-methyltransferase
MFNIVLFEPEIPPNTGNIIRLCANTGATLHLIEPLGFKLEEKKLRRAGLDYHEFAQLNLYKNFADFMEKNQPENLWALSTKGKLSHTSAKFSKGDFFIFGPETRGLPADVMETIGIDHWLRLPMKADSRSLNLSNTAAIMLYEALRQVDFEDLG